MTCQDGDRGEVEDRAAFAGHQVSKSTLNYEAVGGLDPVVDVEGRANPHKLCGSDSSGRAGADIEAPFEEGKLVP